MAQNDAIGPAVGRESGRIEIIIGVGVATLIAFWFAAAALAN